jgi:hypothetical protein
MVERRGRARWGYLLLLIPFLAVLYPPLYARVRLPLAGVPFFIWYQLLWTLLGAAVTGTVYWIYRREDVEEEVTAGPDRELTPP